MTWYGVQMVIYDDRPSTCLIADTVESDTKPENTCKSLKDRDVYMDYFASKEEAERYVAENRK